MASSRSKAQKAKMDAKIETKKQEATTDYGITDPTTLDRISALNYHKALLSIGSADRAREVLTGSISGTPSLRMLKYAYDYLTPESGSQVTDTDTHKKLKGNVKKKLDKVYQEKIGDKTKTKSLKDAEKRTPSPGRGRSRSPVDDLEIDPRSMTFIDSPSPRRGRSRSPVDDLEIDPRSMTFIDSPSPRRGRRGRSRSPVDDLEIDPVPTSRLPQRRASQVTQVTQDDESDGEPVLTSLEPMFGDYDDEYNPVDDLDPRSMTFIDSPSPRRGRSRSPVTIKYNPVTIRRRKGVRSTSPQRRAKRGTSTARTSDDDIEAQAQWLAENQTEPWQRRNPRGRQKTKRRTEISAPAVTQTRRNTKTSTNAPAVKQTRRTAKTIARQQANTSNIISILNDNPPNDRMTIPQIKKILANVKKLEPRGEKTFVRLATNKPGLMKQLQILRNKHLNIAPSPNFPRNIEAIPRHLNEYQMIQRVPSLPPSQKFVAPPMQSQEELRMVQEKYIRKIVDKIVNEDIQKNPGKKRDKAYIDNLKGYVLKAVISPTTSMYTPKDLNRLQPGAANKRGAKGKKAANKRGAKGKKSELNQLEEALLGRLQLPRGGKNPPAMFYPNNGTPFQTDNPAFNQGYVRKGYGEPLIPIRVV